MESREHDILQQQQINKKKETVGRYFLRSVRFGEAMLVVTGRRERSTSVGLEHRVDHRL